MNVDKAFGKFQHARISGGGDGVGPRKSTHIPQQRSLLPISYVILKKTALEEMAHLMKEHPQLPLLMFSVTVETGCSPPKIRRPAKMLAVTTAA